MSITTLYWTLKVIGAFIAIIGGAASATYWVTKGRYAKRAKKLHEAMAYSESSPQFTSSEIKRALVGYIRPDCSQVDPSNEVDISSATDVRENIFHTVDRFITKSQQRRHQLILADSGMGKTSFCLNFYDHFRRTCPDTGIYMLSLAHPDAISRINKMKRKSSSIIILDALDEDPSAMSDGTGRLYDLLQACADFKSVIVTCRSQFFANDAAIPTETGVSIVGPRMAGQNSSYKLYRLYLSGFDRKQVRHYIRLHFPWWNPFSFSRRSAATRLVSNVHELSARPMLLALLPLLVRDGGKSNEIYDLYEYMITKWLDRESTWIPQDRLLAVSKELAFQIHANHAGGGRDRVTLNELEAIADRVHPNKEHWDYLTTRSLLNRDSVGNYKFAHRSIMEFLFVSAAISGDARCFNVQWTDLMKQLFISWGYTSNGRRDLARAEAILRIDLSRTGLLPLSDIPTAPSYTTIPDFENSANRRIFGKGGRRSAPAIWRRESLIVSEDTGIVSVDDLDSYLTWQFQDRKYYAETHNMAQYRRGIAQLQRIFDFKSVYRLPSYAEFITIVEGLDAIGRSDLLPDNELYLLGDQIGVKRNIAVQLGSYKNIEGALTIDKQRIVAPTSRLITAYEFGIYVDPSAYQKLRAVGLGVRTGLADIVTNITPSLEQEPPRSARKRRQLVR